MSTEPRGIETFSLLNGSDVRELTDAVRALTRALNVAEQQLQSGLDSVRSIVEVVCASSRPMTDQAILAAAKLELPGVNDGALAEVLQRLSVFIPRVRQGDRPRRGSKRRAL